MRFGIEVKPVASKRDLRTFVRFPWKVYRDDPNWVPPLISDQIARLTREESPGNPITSLELHIAYRGREPVGTIATFIDVLSNEHLNEQMGGFGFFEVIDDQEVAQHLLDAACETLQKKGMKGIRGPTNFGPNDEPGILVDGYDCPPALLEAHSPRYYDDLLESCGMTKYRDNYAWRVHLSELGPNLDVIPEQMLRVFDTIKQKGGVSIRKADLNVWDREVKIAHRLFNVTLEELPGHVPLNTEEFRRFADQMKPLLDTDMVLFAEVDGEPVGFLVAIPDFNRVLMHLNGRLFPFGWLKLLWHIRKIDVISFKLFGVLKEYRRRGIEVLLYLEAVRSAAAKGYEWLDGSLTSEFNPNILNLTERLGVERYKQFRLYEKMF
ncbi:MAG: hypothetical protein PVF70_10535 [Anaerolineales bacterium]|jgi:GNAT superfamily N-acetyltransferase